MMRARHADEHKVDNFFPLCDFFLLFFSFWPQAFILPTGAFSLLAS
jgi:hypothetical protein